MIVSPYRPKGRNGLDWPKVAVDAGYFDQVHLIRDFRAFSGMTPLDDRASALTERNHVPLER